MFAHLHYVLNTNWKLQKTRQTDMREEHFNVDHHIVEKRNCKLYCLSKCIVIVLNVLIKKKNE